MATCIFNLDTTLCADGKYVLPLSLSGDSVSELLKQLANTLFPFYIRTYNNVVDFNATGIKSIHIDITNNTIALNHEMLDTLTINYKLTAHIKQSEQILRGTDNTSEKVDFHYHILGAVNFGASMSNALKYDINNILEREFKRIYL